MSDIALACHTVCKWKLQTHVYTHVHTHRQTDRQTDRHTFHINVIIYTYSTVCTLKSIVSYTAITSHGIPN